MTRSHMTSYPESIERLKFCDITKVLTMKHALGVHGPSFFWVRTLVHMVNVFNLQKPCYFRAVIIQFTRGLPFLALQTLLLTLLHRPASLSTSRACFITFMTQVSTFVMLQKLKHLIFDIFDTLTIRGARVRATVNIHVTTACCLRFTFHFLSYWARTSYISTASVLGGCF